MTTTRNLEPLPQQESVKDYYGRVLQASSDLRTSACCTSESLPHRIRAIVQQIHPEVLEKFYGCGSPIPPALDGMTVLDLGAGSGRDGFILSRLVGANGRVIGVDMTPAQVAVARHHVEYQPASSGIPDPMWCSTRGTSKTSPRSASGTIRWMSWCPIAC